MSILGDIVQTLKDECPSLQGRASISRSVNNPDPNRLPEAWVFHGNVSAAPSTTVNITTQLLTRGIVVSFATEMEDEAENIDYYTITLDEIILALVGKQVGNSNLPLSTGQSENAMVAEGFTMNRIAFTFEDHVRGAPR